MPILRAIFFNNAQYFSAINGEIPSEKLKNICLGKTI